MSDTWWYFKIFCDTLQNFTIPCDILWYFLYFLISFLLHFVASPVATLRRVATGVLNALIKVEAEHFPAVMAEFLQKGGQEFTPGDAMRLEWWNDGMMELLGIYPGLTELFKLHLMGSKKGTSFYVAAMKNGGLSHDVPESLAEAS